MAGKAGVPVTARALTQRINRKLAEHNEVLKAARGSRAVHDLGDYYVLDIGMNAVRQKDVDLEEFGRSLGVLQPFEKLI